MWGLAGSPQLIPMSRALRQAAFRRRFEELVKKSKVPATSVAAAGSLFEAQKADDRQTPDTEEVQFYRKLLPVHSPALEAADPAVSRHSVPVKEEPCCDDEFQSHRQRPPKIPALRRVRERHRSHLSVRRVLPAVLPLPERGH